MPGVLAVLEQRGGNLKKTAFELLGEARRLADQGGPGPVSALLIGAGVSALASGLGPAGAEYVRVLEHPDLALYSGEGYARLVAGEVGRLKPALLLFPASAMGKDLAPRVAALLGAPLAVDCVALGMEDGALVALRPVFAGKARARVRLVVSHGGEGGVPAMASLRPNVFTAPAPLPGRKAATEVVSADPGVLRDKVSEIVAAATAKVDLTEADVIVTGGRGMKGPEHWHLITDLAQVLGAATGASRAVVDAGWRPHGEQVGQTGKTVTPSLYIACGISGAIQHLAGMSSSKVIVAVNKDPDAPIFKVADFGIVGDVFEVLPRMTEEFKKLKG
jgi:electron transfer flavoprotein alpha subunit